MRWSEDENGHDVYNKLLGNYCSCKHSADGCGGRRRVQPPTSPKRPKATGIKNIHCLHMQPLTQPLHTATASAHTAAATTATVAAAAAAATTAAGVAAAAPANAAHSYYNYDHDDDDGR